MEGLVVQHLTVARVAQGLAVAWDTANDAVLAEGRRVLLADVVLSVRRSWATVSGYLAVVWHVAHVRSWCR